ncbi:MAG: hypothetical protein K0B37_06520 [Bacteroidales bacterium]|nr:hypothetical protein [Bacteroidales bacterium]
MTTRFVITSLLFFWLLNIYGQGNTPWSFRGQASLWTNINLDSEIPVRAGVRYIPQLNLQILEQGNHKIDFELSANITGNTFLALDSTDYSGNIKPYRAWLRYSTSQFEVRAGLQKINFGSAQLLRPLMWFDQMDPRDPLQLTDGVWSLLTRYYFTNNVNIWLWGLYGNEEPKTWEIGQTTPRSPEFGGRFQTPIPRGEAALSFHHRRSNMPDFWYLQDQIDGVPENRVGIDARWDVEIGLWTEAVWIKKERDVGMFTHQQIFNLGADYTFGLGNGLTLLAEQLFYTIDEKAFQLNNVSHLTGLSLIYPVGIFDNISSILFYDWKQKNIYSFFNWQHQLNNLTFYFMAFWNPQIFRLPQQNEAAQLFSGKGFQLMLVYNH